MENWSCQISMPIRSLQLATANKFPLTIHRQIGIPLNSEALPRGDFSEFGKARLNGGRSLPLHSPDEPFGSPRASQAGSTAQLLGWRNSRWTLSTSQASPCSGFVSFCGDLHRDPAASQHKFDPHEDLTSKDAISFSLGKGVDERVWLPFLTPDFRSLDQVKVVKSDLSVTHLAPFQFPYDGPQVIQLLCGLC
ncbi:uncharacterized protein BJX67DRAFT_5102 [Aspergillus lucknowensis]|uniref:Uncharacterized protein n=1 Tax=Aspergillus lucknowensis TaxID=176173 RepID=A0ABR4M6Z5_9EURO